MPLNKKLSLSKNIQIRIEAVFHPNGKLRAKKESSIKSRMKSIMVIMRMVKDMVNKGFSCMQMVICIEEIFIEARGTGKGLCFTSFRIQIIMTSMSEDGLMTKGVIMMESCSTTMEKSIRANFKMIRFMGKVQRPRSMEVNLRDILRMARRMEKESSLQKRIKNLGLPTSLTRLIRL